MDAPAAALWKNLQIKKEEISPKISPLELNLYSIHRIVIIVILKNYLKKESLGEETVKLRSCYAYP